VIGKTLDWDARRQGEHPSNTSQHPMSWPRQIGHLWPGADGLKPEFEAIQAARLEKSWTEDEWQGWSCSSDLNAAAIFAIAYFVFGDKIQNTMDEFSTIFEDLRGLAIDVEKQDHIPLELS
jgi:hypothetical protein